MTTAFWRILRCVRLPLVALGCAAIATSARAVLLEVDLADFGPPISTATLEVGHAGNDVPFTTYSENGITVTPAAGENAVWSSDGNSGLGMRFFQDGGYGDGTAVVVFEEEQRFLGIEVGFSQDHVRVFLFADEAGTQPLGDLVLSEFELVGVDEDEWFAVTSTEPFRRAEIQDVDALGVLQNSNMIAELRFTAVPEPARAVLMLLAASVLAWLPRRRR